MKKFKYTLIILVTLLVFWVVAFGDFREFRYSKNLHCNRIADDREAEICKILEKNQNYEFFGHAIVSFGYQIDFVGARNAWCELHIEEKDEMLLKKMKFGHYTDSRLDIDSRINNGADILFSLLNAKLYPDSPLYEGSVYSPWSSDYLLKAPCNQ